MVMVNMVGLGYLELCLKVDDSWFCFGVFEEFWLW
jgi:hypothetical protein